MVDANSPVVRTGFYTSMIRERPELTGGREYWLHCTSEEQLCAEYVAGHCITAELEDWLGQKLGLEAAATSIATPAAS